MRRLSFFALAVLTLLAGCRQDVSGAYLAVDKSSVCRLQLVRTPDDRLTGQLDCSILGANGKIDQTSLPVVGAISSGNVSITMSKWMGMQTVTLGGTLNGDEMTLSSGGATLPTVLKRSDETDYRRQLAELNTTSNATLAEKAADASREIANERQRAVVAQQAQRTLAIEQSSKDLVTQIAQTVGEIERFDAKADIHLSRFPIVERDYLTFTAKISNYVDRERGLAGLPNAVSTRSQLTVAANQVSLATNQVHLQGQSFESSFESTARPISEQAVRLNALCQGRTTTDLTQPQSEAQNAACIRMGKALAVFHEKYNAVAAALAHLDHVYEQENNKQQSLLGTMDNQE